MSDDIQLYIDGAWTDGSGGRTLPLVNPATEEAIGSVAVAGKDDLERAAIAASSAFESWRHTSPIERGRYLRRAAELLRERADAIVPALTRQQGKTLTEARFEVAATAEILEWFAEEARRAYGRIVPPRVPGIYQMVIKEPVGPCVGFVPWNFGMGQAARKLGPALAAGCTMILKAPEETPTSCEALIRALADAGVPAGVIGLVFGVPAEISAYLVPHPLIRKISFTGSTPVGKQLAGLAGQHMKRVSMELGGHSPVIVTGDVDVNRVAEMLVPFKYRNAGQVCVAPTRFLIEKDVYEPFLDRFTALSKEVKVGDGTAPDTTMGPLANRRRLQALEELVDEAKEQGATAHLAGGRLGNRGNFFAPTILTDVPKHARIMNEEPFGPVAIMIPVADVDEALVEANRLKYGLAAYAFTRSMKAAEKIVSGVRSGMVSVNHFGLAPVELPFGGVNDSGYGSEGGTEAIEAYLSVKMATQAMA